jgi:signal transduction histidine kinase
VVFGLASEWAGFGWQDPRSWMPDLIVGLAFVGCGAYAWPRSRGTGSLLTATGFAWFLGNFATVALYWHRGPLVQILVTYPGGRPRSRLDVGAVVVGYAAAVAMPIWRDERVALVLVVGLAAVVWRGHTVAGGRARRDRRVALQATLAVCLAIAAGAAAGLAVPSGDAAEPTLLVYEVVLCLVAVSLAAHLRPPSSASVADLVVELGEQPSGTLRDSLARTLGDPTLVIGYWDPQGGQYLDVDGGPITVPREGGGGLSTTFVERDGAPFAVLVHDESVLGEPALVEAVAAATRLSAANAALQAEVRAQLVELAESRRRLLAAADDERRRLEARLQDGAERRLATLGELLHRASSQTGGDTAGHVDRAETLLAETVDDLHALALGLHPRELAGGLAPALAALAARSPVPVEVTLPDERFDADVEAAVYFVCAEALANAAKHASASRVAVDVSVVSGRVVVEIIDDGSGGVDPGRGTGLRGLADRVETVGGTLSVSSPSGHGTRVRAELPLGPRTAGPVGSADLGERLPAEQRREERIC